MTGDYAAKLGLVRFTAPYEYGEAYVSPKDVDMVTPVLTGETECARINLRSGISVTVESTVEETLRRLAAGVQ